MCKAKKLKPVNGPSKSSAPKPPLAQKRQISLWIESGGVGLLACVVALWLLHWPDLLIPIAYEGDSLFTLNLVKTMVEYGWFWHNPQLGLPTSMQMLEFPMMDSGHLFILKLLTLVGMTPVLAVNVYFVLSFGLTAGSTVWVLRQMDVSLGIAALGGLAYTLLPYHFMRSVHHLFLAAYYIVPWAAYVLLNYHRLNPRQRTAQWRGCLGVSFLVPAFGAYYGFFYAYLLALVAALTVAAKKSWGAVWQGAVFVGLTVFAMLLNAAPSAIYKMRGTDHFLPVRPMYEVEIYGLKLVQMLLPPAAHEAAWLGEVSRLYSKTAPLVTENAFAALGLLISAAFVAVTVASCVALWRDETSVAEKPIVRASILMWAAFVFGTVGGISSLFGYLVTSYIRSANRIVVFVAFFATVGGAWLSQNLIAAMQGRLRQQAIYGLWLMAMFILLWDTSDVNYFADREQGVARFTQDAVFFKELEQHVPPGTRVFQLPYLPFPEAGVGARDYHPLRPYLQTQSLSYSFGVMRQTSGDRWYAQTCGQLKDNPGEFARLMQDQGFGGVLVERGLYGNTTDIENALTSIFGAPSLQSPNKEFVYFAVR